MLAQPEVDAKVALREVAAAADHFAKLYQGARRCTHACIQSKAIALNALQLKADPVVLRSALRTQNRRLTLQILNDRFELAIVEEIADCHSTAHLFTRSGY